ncbi:MAG: polysaccharide biosynthesis C-terminal domain-containing protein [Bacteroidota bacterium]
MSLIKKLAGETAVYGLSSILGRVVNWGILTPYLTRIFSPEDYGIINIVFTAIALLLVLYTYRMETTYFRFARGGQTDDTWDAATVFTTATMSIAATTLLFTGLLFLLTPWLTNWLLEPGMEHYFHLLLVIVALDAVAAIPFARLRLTNRPVRFATIKLAAIGLNIVLVFFFLKWLPQWANRGVTWATTWYAEEARISYYFLANVIASGVTLLWLLPLYRGVVWQFATALWRKMLHYALPLVLAGVAGIVNQLIGTPLLKLLGPGTAEENFALGGIYAAAAKLAVLMNLFVQAFNYAAEPFFFRQSGQSNDKQIYADVARAFALVGSLAFLGIMLYRDLIQYFLGEDFRQGLGILPILLIANFFLGLFYNFSMGFKLTDQTHLGGKVAILGSVITLGINILFIPSLTIYAPAWASLACFFTMCVTTYWLTYKHWPVPYALGRMAYYLVLGVGTWALCVGLRGWLPVGLGYTLGLNTVGFWGSLVVLYLTEKQWITSVLKT